jgi:hypothetical protein
VGLLQCGDKDGWRWIVDAHKGDFKRYMVHSDELLSAFLELEPVACRALKCGQLGRPECLLKLGKIDLVAAKGPLSSRPAREKEDNPS